MHVTDDIYVERRAASTRSSPVATHESGGERSRGEVLVEATVDGEFLPVEEKNRSTSASLRGFGFNNNSGAIIMPSLQQSPGGLQHHRGRSAGHTGEGTADLFYANSVHDLSTELDVVRPSRNEWDHSATHRVSPSHENDSMHHRVPPPPAGLDLRSTQLQGNGCGYNQGPALGSIQRVPMSEAMQQEHSASARSGGAPPPPGYFVALAAESGQCHRVAARAHQHKFSRSMGDGGFRSALQQQEPFLIASPSTVGMPRSEEDTRRALGGGGEQIAGEGFVAGNGAGGCSVQQVHMRYCPCPQAADLTATVIADSGDHNGWNPNLRTSPQLERLSSAQPSVGVYGGDLGQGQRQQQVHRHQHPQLLPTEDRPRYGHGLVSRGGNSQQPTPMSVERLNGSVIPGDGLGLNAGSHHRGGIGHRRVYTSGTVYPTGDTMARPQTLGTAVYPLEASASHFAQSPSTVPAHVRSRSDGRYDRDPVALSTGPSVSNMLGSSHNNLGRRDASHGSPPDGHNEAFVNGRWQGVGVVDPSGSMAVSGGGGDYHAAGISSHPELSQGETVLSSVTTSTCRGFNVTRRSAPHHHHQQLDCLSAFPSGGDGGINAFHGGTPSREVLDSPPAAFVTMDISQSLSPREHRSRNGMVTPVDRIPSVERNASPEIAVHATVNHGGASVLAKLPAPKNPFEWLQNLRHTRTGSKEKAPGTPHTSRSTSRSSSMSSLASPARFAALLGAGDGRGCHQRSGSMPQGMGMCPAPDCPGNGDCLPGATPDMLVYEVKFKRATRTFLPGDIFCDKGISVGDLMKVEADRGEDLGTVHRTLPLSEYLHALYEEKKAKANKIAENGGGDGGGSEGKKKRSKSKKHDEDGGKNAFKQQQQKKQEQAQEEVCPVKAIKRILRPASPKELEQLEEKGQEEAKILRVCQTKVRNRSLPMKIVDAEYQFDQHKLTLFFEAERRIDFRELVRDLFAVYKTRIWMQQVKDKDNQSTATAEKSTAAPSDNGSGPGGGPMQAAAALIPTHETDHDSGYGSSGSSGSASGRPRYDGEGLGNCVGGMSHGRSVSLESENSSSSALSISWPGETAGGADVAAGMKCAGPFPILLRGFDF